MQSQSINRVYKLVIIHCLSTSLCLIVLNQCRICHITVEFSITHTWSLSMVQIASVHCVSFHCGSSLHFISLHFTSRHFSSLGFDLKGSFPQQRGGCSKWKDNPWLCDCRWAIHWPTTVPRPHRLRILTSWVKTFKHVNLKEAWRELSSFVRTESNVAQCIGHLQQWKAKKREQPIGRMGCYFRACRGTGMRPHQR